MRRVVDDAELARFGGRAGAYVFLFSNDGRYLASSFAPDGGLTVWDVDRGTARFDDPGPVCGRSAGFLPEGRRFFLVHEDGQALLYDLESGQVTRRSAGRPRPNGLAFRPDGVQVALVWPVENTCRLFEVESGRIVQTINVTSPESVAWSPDGSIVAFNCRDTNVRLWDAFAGTWRGVLKGAINWVTFAGFHSAGTPLACNGWEQNLRLWEPQLGRPVLTLSGCGGTDFGPDGRVVLLQGENLVIHEVDAATEYRTLAHPFEQRTPYWEVSVHPGGQLLAVGTDTGLILWDLVRGTELAYLPLGIVRGVRFADSGELVTSGTLGVCRWPVQIDAHGGPVRVGPPHVLPLPSNSECHGMDRSGRVVALPRFSEALVHTPERDFRIGPLDDNRAAAVSPDGQWLATGYHDGMGAHVWRIRDSVKVANLPTGVSTYLCFSPDGRYLMTKGNPCRLWEVGTWAEARRIGDLGVGFTPDGRTLVVQDGHKVLRLVECATGRTLARFENPDQFGARHVTFSPDGARMVVSTHDGPSVHVWDLRAIRHKLAAMGLDWDAPSLPEGPEPSSVAGQVLPPLKLSVDYGSLSGHLEQYTEPAEGLVARHTERLKAHPDDVEAIHQRGHALRTLKRFEDALGDFTSALTRRPGDSHLQAYRGVSLLDLKRHGPALDDLEAVLRTDPETVRKIGNLALVCNDQAWMLATGPARDRDSEVAVRLARLAVAVAPEAALYLNTLGVAEYRAGHLVEAIATLEKSLEASRGKSDAFDLFFLAMARHRSGESARAAPTSAGPCDGGRSTPSNRPNGPKS